jgi:pimeloyl-ACP methyl ester carboxylesterase
MTTFFYLHGWASSPQSSKAQFFKQCFEQRGLSLQIPDLNQKDFYHLTLTRQIQQVEALLPDSPVTIIGSSFGGLITLWLAERQPQIQCIVVLAPALNFLSLCKARMGETQFARWRSQGEFAFYYYAEQRERLISYAFIEDLHQYVDADLLQRRVPTLILHGNKDDVVPIQMSRDFAATRPWVKLVEFDSDHRLTDVQAQLWQAISSFPHAGAMPLSASAPKKSDFFKKSDF